MRVLEEEIGPQIASSEARVYGEASGPTIPARSFEKEPDPLIASSEARGSEAQTGQPNASSEARVLEE